MDGVNLGYAEVITATDKALLVDVYEGEQVWVPKSAIHDDSEVYSVKSSGGDLIVLAWWAREHGY